MDELNNAFFLEKLRSGDAQCFATLFEYLHLQLARFVRKTYDLDERDAEEIAADTLFKVHRSIRQFDAGRGTKLTTWVFEIAKNTALDFLRLKNRSQLKDAEVATEYQQFQTSTATAPAVDKRIERLQRALIKLNDEDRDLLLRRTTLEYDEIAAAENVAVGTVRTRYSRAAARLKEAFEKD